MVCNSIQVFSFNIVYLGLKIHKNPMKFNLYTVLSTESLVVGAGHSWLSVISRVCGISESEVCVPSYPVSTFHRLRDQLYMHAVQCELSVIYACCAM